MSFESILKNKDYLEMAVLHKSVKPLVTENIQRLVLTDDTFWMIVKETIKLTRPILNIIDQIVGDSPAIYKVFRLMQGLEELFTDLHFLSTLDQKKAKEIYDSRKTFIFHPVQLAADFLNPKSRGETLSEEQCNEAISFIVVFAERRGYNCDSLLNEIAEYNAKEGGWLVK